MTADEVLGELMSELQDMEIKTSDDRDSVVGILQYYITKLGAESLPEQNPGVGSDFAYEVLKDKQLCRELTA